MTKTLAVLLGVIVSVGFWGIIFHDMLPHLRTLRALARSGAQVTGTVTAKEPMNHASVRYEYFVGGVGYSGEPCGPQGQFESIRIGDPIAVTYLPYSPAVSVCGDAKTAYDTIRGIAFIVVPCVSLLAGGLMAFGCYRRFRHVWRRGSSNQSLEPTTGRRDVQI